MCDACIRYTLTIAGLLSDSKVVAISGSCAPEKYHYHPISLSLHPVYYRTRAMSTYQDNSHGKSIFTLFASVDALDGCPR